jgi:hypothetical protein
VAAIAALALVRWTIVEKSLRPRPGDFADAKAQRLLAEDARFLADVRLESSALKLIVPAEFNGQLNARPATARLAFAQSARLGKQNAVVEMQRAQILAGLDERDAAVNVARLVIAREGAARPFLFAEYAETLAAVGRRQEANEALVHAMSDARLVRERNAEQLTILTDTLVRLSASEPSLSTSCAVWNARSRIAIANRDESGVAADVGIRPAACAADVGSPTAAPKLSR